MIVKHLGTSAARAASRVQGMQSAQPCTAKERLRRNRTVEDWCCHPACPRSNCEGKEAVGSRFLKPSRICAKPVRGKCGHWQSLAYIWIAGSTLQILEQVAVHSEIRPRGVYSSDITMTTVQHWIHSACHIPNHDPNCRIWINKTHCPAPWLVPSHAEVLIARMRKADSDLPRAGTAFIFRGS